MPTVLAKSALVVLAVAFAAACSAEVGIGEEGVDPAELEQEVSDQLAASVGETPESVDCPDRLPAEEGSQVRCTLTAEDGSQIGVTVTSLGIEDDEVRIDIEVDDEVQS